MQGPMAVTTLATDFVTATGKKRVLQEQGLRAEHIAIVEQLSAEALASCPSEFLCPISLEIMHFPVMVMATGQTYDLMSILSWLVTGGTTCPLTGLQLNTRVELRLMKSLRARISQWLNEQGVDLDGTVKEVAKRRNTAGGNGSSATDQDGENKQLERSIIGGICAVFRFLGGESKMYGSIY